MKGLLAKVHSRERGVVIIWIAFFMITMLGFVAQVLGIKSMSLSATATAEASPASGICNKLAPMGAIPGVTGQPTDFLPGCAHEYTLKQGQGGGVQGNYQALDFPACADGACAG